VATVYLLFPFLIWMTLRVSSTATHTGILLVTLVANWSASHGYGPFQNLPPQDSAMALQLFLAGLAMPVLCLAAANHERNQALQFNKDLSGRLMTAQEEERARIAQDLHDDVNQRLAYIGLLASQIRRDLPGTADAMANLQTKVADAAEAVRLASRQLYPASLEQAGLRAAASALCLEFAQLTGRKLDFVAEPGYLALPQPAALCLYRILQESLHNVERHSHATEVRVSLSATADRVLLTVVDNGRGFSRNEARGSTLGLRSMEHRVESVGGAVEVKGRPGVGTVVRAWVPRAERAKAAGA
jgi:two-component system sensor histidine kinase UhpB